MIKHFRPHEFADFGKMDPEFLEWLDHLREQYGKPIRINSSYRDPNYNERVGGVKFSAHTEVPCKAVDIHCPNSKERMTLVRLALELHCRRIGIGKNFIHLDFGTDRVDNVMWTYYK